MRELGPNRVHVLLQLGDVEAVAFAGSWRTRRKPRRWLAEEVPWWLAESSAGAPLAALAASERPGGGATEVGFSRSRRQTCLVTTWSASAG